MSAAPALTNPTVVTPSYAQWGEDRIIWDWLFSQSKSGVFFEAGANHPVRLSQTYLLEQMGWTGVLADPVPSCCELLRAQRPQSRVFQVALGTPAQRGKLRFRIPEGITELTELFSEGDPVNAKDTIFEAEVRTVNDLLEEAGVQRLDYLVLDTEGMELSVMMGFDFARYRPRVILIEDRNDSLAKHRYLKQQGYRLVRRFGSNNCYVPRSQPVPVPLAERWKLLRKLYLAIPFRKLRSISRRLRGKR
jgi:FkbM family methyltransferase